MDKETLSNYGWIVICVLVLAVMIALASPFGNFVADAVKSTAQGLFDTNQNALDAAGITIDDNGFADSDTPRVTTLAGTTWKFNDNLTGVEIFDKFNYQEQTGWDNFPSNTLMKNDKITYNIWGFTRNEAFGASYFITVQSMSEYSIGYTFPNSLGLPQGWYVVSPEASHGFLTGSVTDMEALMAGLTPSIAPTVQFGSDSNDSLENAELINWMYENATIQ